MDAREYRDESCAIDDCEMVSIVGCEAETGDCSCATWDLCVIAAERDALLGIVRRFCELWAQMWESDDRDAVPAGLCEVLAHHGVKWYFDEDSVASPTGDQPKEAELGHVDDAGELVECYGCHSQTDGSEGRHHCIDEHCELLKDGTPALTVYFDKEPKSDDDMVIVKDETPPAIDPNQKSIPWVPLDENDHDSHGLTTRYGFNGEFPSIETPAGINDLVEVYEKPAATKPMFKTVHSAFGTSTIPDDEANAIETPTATDPLCKCGHKQSLHSYHHAGESGLCKTCNCNLFIKEKDAVPPALTVYFDKEPKSDDDMVIVKDETAEKAEIARLTTENDHLIRQRDFAQTILRLKKIELQRTQDRLNVEYDKNDEFKIDNERLDTIIKNYQKPTPKHISVGERVMIVKNAKTGVVTDHDLLRDHFTVDLDDKSTKPFLITCTLNDIKMLDENNAAPLSNDSLSEWERKHEGVIKDAALSVIHVKEPYTPLDPVIPTYPPDNIIETPAATKRLPDERLWMQANCDAPSLDEIQAMLDGDARERAKTPIRSPNPGCELCHGSGRIVSDLEMDGYVTRPCPRCSKKK